MVPDGGHGEIPRFDSAPSNARRRAKARIAPRVAVMNILLIGSGGREHALAWAIAASPLCDRLFVAPGNPGIGPDRAATSTLECDGPCRGDRLLPGGEHRPRRGGPEAPLVAGLADDLASRRHQVLRADEIRRPARRLQGLHQGHLRQLRHPHRRLWPLHGQGGGAGLSRGAGRAHRHQGGWARGRQGRDRGDGHGDGARGGRGHLLRQVRRGRMRDRGVPRRRGGELLRADRWQERPAARHRAGPQAGGRWRHRPQHRRHGRLFALPPA